MSQGSCISQLIAYRTTATWVHIAMANLSIISLLALAALSAALTVLLPVMVIVTVLEPTIVSFEWGGAIIVASFPVGLVAWFYALIRQRHRDRNRYEA